MILQKTHKLLFRAFIVFIIQLMIKGFDQTFGGFFDFTVRGFVLTGFIVPFWLLVWYVAEYINNKLNKIHQIWFTLLHIVFGFLCSFLTNLAYRNGDIYFFNNYHVWENNTLLNPEYTLSLTLFYMIIWGFGQYHQSDLKYKQEQIKTEKLMKENSLAQYMSLKAQIEPHFLFNSLSVLNSLIYKDANLASEFTIKLSKTMRYIIDNNDFQLVSVADEMSFVKDYFFLIRTRFLEGIVLNVQLDTHVLQRYVPPASIQILIENAVKHNKFSVGSPLNIDITSSNNYIIVQNNLNKRKAVSDSTNKGLSNLKKRYELLIEKPVLIHEKQNSFMIQIPLIDKAHENINY